MRVSVSIVVWVVVVAGLFVVATLSGLVPLTGAVLAVIAVCFVFEMVDSSLGMGYGTSLTPILLLAGFEPHELVPTILVSEFLSGFAAFFFHAEAGNVRLDSRSVHLRSGMTLSVFSVVGVLAGVNLALNLSKIVLTRLIGGVILLAGLVLLVSLNRRFVYRTWKIAVLGLVASFNKAVSGGGYGPLMTAGQILSGVEGRAAVGITSFAEGFTCLAGSALFLALGERLDPVLLVPVVTGALLSVPFSAQIVRVAREDLVKRVIAVLTLALGAFTLVKSLF